MYERKIIIFQILVPYIKNNSNLIIPNVRYPTNHNSEI